jgi:phospholipid transport system transporter-binding protein
MSDARLDVQDGERVEVQGALDFHSVPALWAQLKPRLDGRDWVLDLGGVERANSAGLALLLEAHDQTRRHGGRMQLRGLPESLRQLAAMSGLEDLLEQLRG